MISVIIPTLNAETTLVAAFAPLVAPTAAGLVKEVIVADGGSDDATRAIAEAAGARLVQTARGRGRQLSAGADAARADWLLFLHADTVLSDGWADAAAAFIKHGSGTAAAFAFKLDHSSRRARITEAGVNFRARVLKLPYGDQALLIDRALYDDIGGFKPMPLMEDVDIVRRIKAKRLRILPAAAVTSAARFLKRGYGRRIARNWVCLALYYAGVAPERIAAFYDR